MSFSNKKIGDTVSLMLSYYKNQGRSFPWRETNDPYHVLVSEYMLQQTQTNRVIDKFSVFIKNFPSIESLADADRRKVLSLWSGLGYNRRAIALHKAAGIVKDMHEGIIPDVREQLLKLPGVGDYTSGAVLAFAYNKPVIIVETNIRTVIFYHCLRGKSEIDDAAVRPLVEKMLSHALKGDVSPRIFYSAIMDYGSHLKSTGVSVNSLSRHYTKQGKFKGSTRQARGALLRVFIDADKGVSKNKLENLDVLKIKEGLAGLVADGVIVKKGKYYYLA